MSWVAILVPCFALLKLAIKVLRDYKETTYVLRDDLNDAMHLISDLQKQLREIKYGKSNDYWDAKPVDEDLRTHIMNAIEKASLSNAHS